VEAGRFEQPRGCIVSQAVGLEHDMVLLKTE